MDDDNDETKIDTFTLQKESIVKIDIYTIISKRMGTIGSQPQVPDNHWINWDCKAQKFIKCKELYNEIDEKLKKIIFFIGFRTMIYGDHLHDFGSNKVYTSSESSESKEAWSQILFNGCLIDIKWFINNIIPTKSKATQQSSNIETKIINILKYLLLNQFMFWYNKTIKNVSKLFPDLEKLQVLINLITTKYNKQKEKICSITNLNDYIKIFKYIDFCGYYCGNAISQGGLGRIGNRAEEKSPLQYISSLHDEMGKFICNWTLKSIFCIYSKSVKNLLGCDEEQLSKNFKKQNIHIYDNIYKKQLPHGANPDNAIIQLRIDQEGDTRNHLAIFNSITEYTRQYITCENNNIDTDEDSDNITSNFDNDVRYILNLLSNKASNGLGIIYDYAGWQDPGCNTLPRLRKDLATLNNELQILVPDLLQEQIYYFAGIPIIKYTYDGPAQGCTYNQFFKYVFVEPLHLTASETSVENIKKYTKALVNPSTEGNVITSNLTIKTFGDLNQCIIFGYYYGNAGFYENQKKFYLPIFMTGDVIAGYMSALISNQVITEKHDKSNTIRKHTRELVDGVIYYLNCSEKDNYNEYIAALNGKRFTTIIEAVGTDFITDEQMTELRDAFASVYPEEEEFGEVDFDAAMEELKKEELKKVDTLDSSSMNLHEDEIEDTLNFIKTSNSGDENGPRKKRKQGEGQKGKQTHKNKAKRTKRAKRARRARRTKRAKQANIDIQTNASLEP